MNFYRLNLKIITLSIATLLCIKSSLNATEKIQFETFETDTGFVINIEAIGYTNQLVYLLGIKEGAWYSVDSAKVVNNKAQFTGILQLPELRYIKFKDSDSKVPVFLENTNITIKVRESGGDPEISGSEIHKFFLNYKSYTSKYEETLDSIANIYYAARDSGNKVLMSKMDILYEQVDSSKNHAIRKYISKNSDNIMGPFVLSEYLLYHLSLDEIEKLYNSLSHKLSPSKYMEKIKLHISKLKLTSVGVNAPDFVLNDFKGNPVSLSDYRGKYVLIDFWASWCGPCRQENPNVVAAYKEFHDKGFEILGVSLDKVKSKWEKAVKDDELSWTHVSDLKGWKNEVAELYGVKGIPFSILVDPRGVIIAKNLRGEELKTALDDIFNKINIHNPNNPKQ